MSYKNFFLLYYNHVVCKTNDGSRTHVNWVALEKHLFYNHFVNKSFLMYQNNHFLKIIILLKDSYNIFMDFNIIYIFFHYKMWRKIPWKIITCPFISWITSVFEKYIINYYARLLCNFIILNLVQDKSVIYRLISIILIITSKIPKQYLLLIELNTL